MDDLNSDNYVLFAATHYWSIHYTTKEFSSDLKKISYIKRLINKYLISGALSERLILNHLILLFNVFKSPSAVQKMLFLKVDYSGYAVLKTFLVYMNQMPDEVEFNNKTLILSDIPLDLNIVTILRTL